MKRTIYFDMDGTIVDLYGFEGWLDCLINGDTTPYAVAKPLMRMNILARYLNKLQRDGYRIGIISWLSKSGTDEYNARVEQVKLEWLAKHLPSVHFDEINIVAYGTPKYEFAHTFDDILFDDEIGNRANWGFGQAYDVDNIIEVLKNF